MLKTPKKALSNECFLRFEAQRKAINTARPNKNTSGNVQNVTGSVFTLPPRRKAPTTARANKCTSGKAHSIPGAVLTFTTQRKGR